MAPRIDLVDAFAVFRLEVAGDEKVVGGGFGHGCVVDGVSY